MGKTAAEILRLSREQKATMIVMGHTGKDWFQEYWLGGVSHRLAEIPELPVLLVP
ncbi:MAG: universal stress protein [Desulfobacterales bacterium]